MRVEMIVLVFSDVLCVCFFFFSSRRRHTRLQGDWSSDVCSSDLVSVLAGATGDCAACPVLLTCRFSSRSWWTSFDRKSVVWGKSVDLGGRRIIKKKK